MNDIQGINGYARSNSIRASQNAEANQAKRASVSASRKEDAVEISQIAMYLSKIAEMPDIRQEKVEEVRQALASGEYDIDGKLSMAVDEFMEEYFPE